MICKQKKPLCHARDDHVCTSAKLLFGDHAKTIFSLARYTFLLASICTSRKLASTHGHDVRVLVQAVWMLSEQDRDVTIKNLSILLCSHDLQTEITVVTCPRRLCMHVREVGIQRPCEDDFLACEVHVLARGHLHIQKTCMYTRT